LFSGECHGFSLLFTRLDQPTGANATRHRQRSVGLSLPRALTDARHQVLLPPGTAAARNERREHVTRGDCAERRCRFELICPLSRMRAGA
jgi:hypothetical protein